VISTHLRKNGARKITMYKKTFLFTQTTAFQVSKKYGAQVDASIEI
jgi:hypothetical protein